MIVLLYVESVSKKRRIGREKISLYDMYVTCVNKFCRLFLSWFCYKKLVFVFWYNNNLVLKLISLKRSRVH